MAEIALRLATISDMRDIFSWRNHPDVRRYSFQNQEIRWDEHKPWFEKAIQNPSQIILIGQLEQKPVGVLRYSLNADTALVSIYLVPGLVGRGIGTQLLKAGHDWLREQQPEVANVHAEIQFQNEISVRAFEKAGYQLLTSAEEVHTYVYPLIFQPAV